MMVMSFVCFDESVSFPFFRQFCFGGIARFGHFVSLFRVPRAASAFSSHGSVNNKEKVLTKAY